ncbi:MAG: O-antigen ligase family protein [Gemmatimonadetes bacterium]|nr:O-antigen ligase family protein [Gemmatimonadota bacterium]
MNVSLTRSRRGITPAPALAGGGAAAAIGPLSGFAAHAPFLAIAMLAVVAVRFHEVLPLIPALRPALLLSVGGTIYLWTRTSAARRKAVLANPTIRLVLIYYGWCILTVLTSMWRTESINSLRAFMPAVLLALALLMVPPRRDIVDRVQRWFVFLLGAFGAAAMVLGNGWRGRLEFGGMYDSNDLATLMIIGFPMAIGVMTRGAGRTRTLAAVCAAIMMFTVVATGSRGGVLGFAVAVMVIAAGLKGTRRLWVAGLMAFGLLVAWGTSSRIFQYRVRSIWDLENDYNYTSDVGRKAIWERGRGYILAHPVLGVGIGCFPVAEGGSWDAMGRTGKWSTAHNAYIQAGAELGIPGGALYIILLINGAVIARRLARGYRLPDGRREYRAEFVASMAGFATTAVFLSHAYFNGLFALIGLIALTERAFQLEASGGLSPQAGQPVPLQAGAAHARNGERGGLALGVARFSPWPDS